MTPEGIYTAFTGPLDTIRTPFLQDGSIDYDGVRKTIDGLLAARCGSVILTAGNSHFHCMAEEEITELARVAAEHTAGRAPVVAADYCFDTQRAVAFARTCTGMGVDILMIRPPDWDGTSTTTESLIAHYGAVAAHIPVMLVTNLFAGRGDQPALDTIEAIRESVPNVVAVKDDLGGTFAQRLCLLVRDHWAVFSGGGFLAHLNTLPFGVHGFMTPFMSYQPRIAQAYWTAIQADDLAKATSIYKTIEVPLEAHLRSYPGGRDAALHGLFELSGMTERWRRAPYHSLTDEAMMRLRQFVEGLDIL